MGKRKIVVSGLVTLLGALTLAPLGLAPQACSQLSTCNPPARQDIQLMQLDEHTWASNRLQDPWLPFDGMRSYFLHWNVDLGLPNLEIVNLSVDQNPGNPQENGGGAANWAQAAGNLAEFSDPYAGGVVVQNDTCADYYAQIVLTFAVSSPFDAGAGASGDAAAVEVGDAASASEAGEASVTDASDAAAGD